MSHRAPVSEHLDLEAALLKVDGVLRSFICQAEERAVVVSNSPSAEVS